MVVRHVDFDPADCTLRMDELAAAINPRTRVVAVGYASNAVGTVNDIAAVASLAHAVGAWAFVDAVHYAPHGLIDVQALGCDLLACSVYKFFGPHLGVLYGRYELLEALPAYKVRPAHDAPPHKFEPGTPSFESIAELPRQWTTWRRWAGALASGQTPRLPASPIAGARSRPAWRPSAPTSARSAGS